MTQQLRRLGMLACSAAALMVTFASGAQAAPVVATTGPGVTGSPAPTAEYLTGAINTNGGATIWQFEYGTTTAYGHTTPLKVISAGHGFVVVAFPLTGLKPNTTYHFRLDARAEVVGAYGYYYPLSGVGADVTFRTARAGTIALSSTKFKVRQSRASFGLTCKSTIACRGRYTTTVKHKVRGQTKTVTCFSGTFSLKAGAKGTYDPKVAKGCLALFKHRKLSGVTFTATTTTYQPKLTKKVTLQR